MSKDLNKILPRNNYISILSILFIFSLSITNGFSQCGNGKSLIQGPRGGCYYLTKSGRKEYVDRSCCSALGLPKENFVNLKGSSSDCGFYKNKPLIKGSKGGCYYINRNGNKSYIARNLCKC